MLAKVLQVACVRVCERDEASKREQGGLKRGSREVTCLWRQKGGGEKESNQCEGEKESNQCEGEKDTEIERKSSLCDPFFPFMRPCPCVSPSF